MAEFHLINTCVVVIFIVIDFFNYMITCSLKGIDWCFSHYCRFIEARLCKCLLVNLHSVIIGSSNVNPDCKTKNSVKRNSSAIK